MNKRTPWGMSDSHEKLADGIDWYSTPSHGGVKLDLKRNAAIPEIFRTKGSWYEEDCEWAIACYFHPEGWLDRDGIQEMAIATLKTYFWRQWEQFHGVELAPGESHCKDEHMLREKHKDDYKVVAAFSRYCWIPKGMIGVLAQINDRRVFTSHQGIEDYEKDPKSAGVYFLVPEEEYDKRGSIFVIDLARHQRLEGDPTMD